MTDPVLVIVREDDDQFVVIPFKFCSKLLLLTLVSPGGQVMRNVLFELLIERQGGKR
jgi:hypothetical protein